MIETAEWFGFLRLILEGAWITVVLTVSGCLLGFVVAFTLGLTRMSRYWAVRFLVGAFVEFFRGTSIFIQLFWAYFVLPLFGLTLPAIAAGILVLGLNVGAYGSEIVRGAILAVPKEQNEACIAVNLTKWQAMRWIIVPQALIRMMPSLNNLAIELLKGTSVASLITISDMTFQAQLVRTATATTATPFITILIIYFALALIITKICQKIEARLSRGLDVVRV